MYPEDRYPALEAAAKAYWSKHLYEDDYREFTDWFRPECEALQEKLCVVNPSSLGHSELVDHVAKCYDYAADFWKVSFNACTKQYPNARPFIDTD